MPRILLVLLAPLVLTGCMLSPGKFQSELQLMRNGDFAFSYSGEIQMLALSKLAEMANKQDDFKAECYDDDFEERECTLAEIDEQRVEWDAAASKRAAKQKEEAEQMKALLGGIDPSNPEAAQEVAAKLQRQRGWEEVTYRGDGLFNVDFRISGRTTHDFAFPVIEKMPVGNMFVTVVLRDGGQVRVDAPGFAAQGGGNPMQGMMAGMAGMMQLSEKKEDEDPGRIVTPEGSFTIVTDGRILANNTDEGPSSSGPLESLSWTIDKTTVAAPTALIALED